MIEKKIIDKVKDFALKNKEFILNANIVNDKENLPFFRVFDKNNEECIIYNPIVKNLIDEIYDMCFKGKETRIKTDFLNHLPEFNNKDLLYLEENNIFNKKIFFNETIFPIFMFIWAVVKDDKYRNREILTIHKTNIEKLIPTQTCPICKQKIIIDYNSEKKCFTTSKLIEYKDCSEYQ